jgi:hypothetical protein
MRKAIGVIALMVLPVSAATLSFAGVAGAASGVTCTSIKGSLSGKTGTISGCTDKANTGTKGTFPIAALTGGSGSITWNKTGTTAITVTGIATVTPNKCPKGDTEYHVTANVTGGTGAAAKSIKTGWTLSAFVCVTKAGAFSLLKGQKVNIGPKF